MTEHDLFDFLVGHLRVVLKDVWCKDGLLNFSLDTEVRGSRSEDWNVIYSEKHTIELGD